MLESDKKYYSKYNLIAGIDEAGRGPLAGPVVAASVIFEKNISIDGVNDSKKISSKKRDLLYDKIIDKALYIGIGIVHSKEIDEINILNATKKAMELSILDLGINPDFLLIDGNQIELSDYKQESIIKGDTKSFSIASASIIAKVTRDRMMENYAKILPDYGFQNHKGYGTKKHIESIVENKSSIIHRKSFNPVSNHLPSFNYYIKNNILDKLLIQVAGDYLIKNNYSIISVIDLCINSKLNKKEKFFHIKSNLLQGNNDGNHDTIELNYKNGRFEININSI